MGGKGKGSEKGEEEGRGKKGRDDLHYDLGDLAALRG